MTARTIKIAVLECERNQSDAICRVLSLAGYDCKSFADSNKWLERSHTDHFDMLILGNSRSEPGWLEIIRQARSRMHQNLPILLLVASNEIDAVLAALSAGANDCLYLPVRPNELKTRVSVLLYRAYPDRMPNERAQYGPFMFDMRSARLTRNGIDIPLAKKEFELAVLFFRHLGRPLSRAYISEAIWEIKSDSLSRTVDTHVSRVRNKLQLTPKYGFQLAQVYGYGYRLEETKPLSDSVTGSVAKERNGV